MVRSPDLTWMRGRTAEVQEHEFKSMFSCGGLRSNRRHQFVNFIQIRASKKESMMCLKCLSRTHYDIRPTTSPDLCWSLRRLLKKVTTGQVYAAFIKFRAHAGRGVNMYRYHVLSLVSAPFSKCGRRAVIWFRLLCRSWHNYDRAFNMPYNFILLAQLNCYTRCHHGM